MIDHVTDTSRRDFMHIMAQHAMPEALRSEPLMDKEAAADEPATSFAWPAQKLYPITSPQDTWLSVMYFQKNAEAIPAAQREYVARRLIDAVKIWELEGTFAPVEQKVAEAPHTDILYKDVNGQVLHTARVASPEDFQKVAINLLENRHEIEWDIRKDVAGQLLKTAEDMGFEVPDLLTIELERTAGMGSAPVRQLQTLVASRGHDYARSLHYKVAQDLLDGVANDLQALPKDSLAPTEMAQKVAHITDYLDTLTRAHSLGYDAERLPAPESFCFSMTPKVASQLKTQFVKLANGRVTTINKVAENKARIEDVLHKFASPTGDVKKDLEGLDRITADQVVRLVPELIA